MHKFKKEKECQWMQVIIIEQNRPPKIYNGLVCRLRLRK